MTSGTASLDATGPAEAAHPVAATPTSPRAPLAVREPRWIVGLAGVLAFAAVCVLLGGWQWSRKETIDQRNAVLAANYDRQPGDVAAVVDGAGAVPAGREWTPVSLTGRYERESSLLVRNRQYEGRNGYLVVAPLTLDEVAGGTGADGRRVLWVVQGWLPGTAVDSDSDGSASRVAASRSVPAEPVDVVARVRPAEADGGRQAPPGQVQRLATAELAAAAGLDAAAAVDGYAVLADDLESGAGGVGGLPAQLEPVPRPDPYPGPHLAYAVQWWIFGAVALGIWVAFYRRSALAAAGVAVTTGDAGDPTTPPGEAATRDRTPPGRRSRSSPGRRRRDSDPWHYEPGG